MICKITNFYLIFSTEKNSLNSLNFKNEQKFVKFEFSIYGSGEADPSIGGYSYSQLRDIYRATDTAFTDKNVGSLVDVFDGRIACLEVLGVVVDAVHGHHRPWWKRLCVAHLLSNAITSLSFILRVYRRLATAALGP